jgi:hypothetical protein
MATTGQSLRELMTDSGGGTGDQGSTHHTSLARAAVRQVLP